MGLAALAFFFLGGFGGIGGVAQDSGGIGGVAQDSGGIAKALAALPKTVLQPHQRSDSMQ
eukprot:6491537-Amphidinium_carterae.9